MTDNSKDLKALEDLRQKIGEDLSLLSQMWQRAHLDRLAADYTRMERMKDDFLALDWVDRETMSQWVTEHYDD